MSDRHNQNAQHLGPGAASRKPGRARDFVVALGLLISATIGLGACSAQDDRLPSLDVGVGVPIAGSCAPGDQKQCGFTLHQEGDIITCYRGVARCDDDGKWGECLDGEVTQEASPPDIDARVKSSLSRDPQALSGVDSVNCMDHCDPQCMHFIEGDPDLGPPPVVVGGSTPFPGVEGDECLHGLCETGGPLDAACDPCVNTICNLTANGIPPDSACCTSGWDSQCVDQVYTKCLSTPPPVTFGLCDFGIYSLQGTTLANRPTAGAAIGSAGSLTLGTDLGGIANHPACSAGSPTPPGNTSPQMIVTGGDLTIPSQNGANCKQIVIPSGVYVAGSVAAQHGGGTTYVGNWHVGGSIAMNGGNTITGNVRSGSTPTGVTNGGGTWTAPSPAPVIDIPVTLPTRTATCSGANGAINLTGNQTLSRGPGNYSTVSLSNGNNVLSLSPGNYTFQSLNAGGGNSGTRNIIRLVGPATGRWDITVCGNSSVGNWFEIQNNGGARLTDPKQLILYTHGAFSAGTDSYLAGIIWVPNGTFTSSDRTKVNGAVWARTVSSGTDMNAVQISKADCEGLNIPGTTPGGGGGMCPIIPGGAGGLPPSADEPCESGLDCQMNQRCTEVSTSAACAHSKCVPGASLASSCDPCVAKVCANTPSCCASGWTQACVDLVPSLCDASCGGVTGCAHDACTTGSRLVQGCDTGAAGSGNCTQTVCSNAAYAYCCDPSSAQGWNAACVTRAKSVCAGTPSGAGGTNACNYAITGSAVTLGSGAHTNNGTTPIQRVGAGSVTTKNLAGMTCGGTGATGVNSNTSWNADSRANVTVGSGANLTLNAGTHNINSLTLGAWSNSRVTFNGNVTLNICGNLTVDAQTFLTLAAGANVTINVRGNVVFGQGAQVTGLAAGADLLRLKLYAAGNFTMGPNATTRGVFLGGGATSSISMSGGNVGEAIHQGVLWANGAVNMTLQWSAWPAVQNTIPVANCLTATSSLIPAPPVACPVTTPAPVFSGDDGGECVSNDDGWEQPSCAGFDLALEYVCGSTVPVCNHGQANFPGGNVTVGYYSIEDSPAFAVESPGAATGFCSQVLPAIAPGECANLTCTIPTGEDYTVMVDPLDALNECSRLDNWSWRDDDFACGSSSGTTTVEFEYEAICDDDATSPRWKNLTWEATVPSGSSISFSAKVAASLADLGSVPYQALTPTATPGPPDTTTCTLPGCTVGLTDQLGLADGQGRFLSLRIDTDHTGGTPTIDDWTLSYTCQYDQ